MVYSKPGRTVTQLISPRFSLASVGHLGVKQRYHPSQSLLIDEVNSRIADGRYRLRHVSCPCGSYGNDIIIAEIDRYGLPLTSVLCRSCGTVRFDPHLDDDSLENFYLSFYQTMYRRAVDPAEYFSRQLIYGQKLVSVFEKTLLAGSWVFEVGCGAGGGLKAFYDRGFQVAGCDYSAELIGVGRSKGLKNIFQGSVEEIDRQLAEVKADFIYLHHVFEHLNNPAKFLESCVERLAPNGSIVVVVPDISRIEQAGGDSLSMLHIAHLFNYSSRGISALCESVGCVAETVTVESEIATPWSQMPELWMRVRRHTEALSNESRRRVEPQVYCAGDDLLRTLIRTEKSYLRKQRMRNARILLGHFSPKNILRRIRNV